MEASTIIILANLHWLDELAIGILFYGATKSKLKKGLSRGLTWLEKKL